MKVCMITMMTPASENIRGTSAHPYHLLVNRNKDIDVEVYSYNFNRFSDDEIANVENELNVHIKIVPTPKWLRWIFRLKLLFIRLFMKYPIYQYMKLPQSYVEEIKKDKPDIIWVFCAEWSRIVRQFDGFPRIHSMPDSEALYYYRMLGMRFVTHDWKFFFRCMFMYPKYLALERNYSTDSSIHYHLVGEEDANFLKNMNPKIQAHFIRHPHYHISDSNRLIKFHRPKIKILVAGQYNYYMQQAADELVEQLSVLCRAKRQSRAIGYQLSGPDQNSPLTTHHSPLTTHYHITFLGKGWEKHVETLRKAGYEVVHIRYAPNYIEEICKHDIQITPIAIGTGTKGKVLDALANGLLVIGTPYAMENIAVKHGESCIEYQHPQEVIDVLMDIPEHRICYEQMAAKGRDAVVCLHSPSMVSKELFGITKNS